MDGYGPSFSEMLLFYVLPALGTALAVFAGVFLGIVLSGRRLTSRMKPGSVGPSSALSIVQERYARGELSRQEFEQMRSVLEG